MSDDAIVVRTRNAAEEALATIDFNKSDDRTVGRVLELLGAHGLLSFGFCDPKNTGPQADDMRRACAIIRELSAHSGELSNIFSVSALLAPLTVSYAGTPAQKAEMLPKVAEGRLQLAFALTEPGAGSDAASIRTTAAPQGNNVYVLEGEKIYITGAATADFILTIAKSSPDNPKAFGIFVTPKNSANLTVEPLTKLAGNTMPSCKVAYDKVEIDAGNILGGAAGLESAWPVLRNTGMLERLVVAASSCGLARAATTRATEFIRERRQFGKPLKEFQAIQHAVVEMATLTTGMELFMDNAVQAQRHAADPSQAISMAKYFCSEQLQRVVEIAMRVMGGRSYFEFEPVSRFYREAPLNLFAGGTVEIQKMLIARTMGI